ncbi:uncharacterized protein A4U43_C03F3740 [Asparagus officinalis]|uniref:Uncharacterized protein n=1 Tax=Asparagus officinalis TaxID=4686 RepID=A0A5P1FC37_ASPOF|nr:uncharacterized protein A4U43_C03F3740 [Asparagus officinalis]
MYGVDGSHLRLQQPAVADSPQNLRPVHNRLFPMPTAAEAHLYTRFQARSMLPDLDKPKEPQKSRFAPFSSQLTSEQVTEMNWMQTQGINQMEVYRVDAVDGSNPFYNSHDTVMQ